MIFRWFGSLAGAAVLTVATYLAMPAMLRVESMEAVEEFHRLYEFYNIREERAPFWQPIVCEHCYFDNTRVVGEAIVLDELRFVRRGHTSDYGPLCHSEFTTYVLPDRPLSSYYQVLATVSAVQQVNWSIDRTLDQCRGIYFCPAAADYQAIDELIGCLGQHELPVGEHRLTIAFSGRTTP
ncbi:MAG: hypothetical protein GC188_12870 [Alphaproteobacteria bacterium]|nr:hypothetical protein [Alphaproteobacteria bacterium]